MSIWLSKRVESFFDNAVVSFGLTKFIDFESAVLTGLVVFAALLTIWSKVREAISIHVERGRSRLTPSDIEAQIWDWLKRYQYTLAANIDPTCDFSLNATLPNAPMGVTIAKDLGTPWIAIRTGVRCEPDRRKLVEDHAPLLAKDIAVELIKFGVEHDIQLDDEGRLALLVIRILMPFDANTTDLELMKNMGRVRGAAGLAAEMYNRAFEQANVQATKSPAKLAPSKPSSEAHLPPESAS